MNPPIDVTNKLYLTN